MKSFTAPYRPLHLGAVRASTHHHVAVAARSLRGHGGSREEEEHGQTAGWGRVREERRGAEWSGEGRGCTAGLDAVASLLLLRLLRTAGQMMRWICSLAAAPLGVVYKNHSSSECHFSRQHSDATCTLIIMLIGADQSLSLYKSF